MYTDIGGMLVCVGGSSVVGGDGATDTDDHL